MADERFSFETPENETRAAVATHKLCAGGCGKTWKEAGGGWQYFADARRLETKWYCDPCDALREHPTTKADTP